MSRSKDACQCKECVNRYAAALRTRLAYWTAREESEGPDSGGCDCTACRSTQWTMRQTRDAIQRDLDAVTS